MESCKNPYTRPWDSFGDLYTARIASFHLEILSKNFPIFRSRQHCFFLSALMLQNDVEPIERYKLFKMSYFLSLNHSKILSYIISLQIVNFISICNN